MADNTVIVSGGVINLRNTATNNVTWRNGSSGGKGILNVSGTAVMNIDAHIFQGVASASTTLAPSRGELNISGGTVNLGVNLPTGGFIVNGEYGVGTVNVTGGTLNLDFFQNGRRNVVASQGQVTQTAGTVNVRASMNVGGLSQLDNRYTISGGNLNLTGVGTVLGEAQTGLHIARFTSDPSVGTMIYSNGRLDISGSANVAIAGGLYNSTGWTPSSGSLTGVALPGGTGTVLMSGGTLTAGALYNGAAANAGSYGTGASAYYIQSGGVASVGPVTGTGKVVVSGGTMTVSSMAQAEADVSGGTVVVTPNGTDAAASRLAVLGLSGTGRYDLNNNDMTVTSSSYATVSGQVASARAGGSWAGPGLTSTSAKTDPTGATTLGVLKGSEYIALGGTTFGGQPVAPTDTLVKYTYYGDADFTGAVDFDDYVRIDGGLNNGLTGWLNGDFDFSGGVDFDDYVLIDLAFNAQGGSLRRAQAYLDGSDRSTDDMNTKALQKVVEHFGDFGTPYAANFLASVPEPASLGMIAAAAVLFGRRRRA
jgi:hypothetical protein